MKQNFILEDVKYLGVNDHDIDLFESQYTVPQGVSYNSYMIMDEEIAIMDCVDKRKIDEWLCNVETALEGRTPSYLVVTHMEPDHSAGVARLVEKYPEIKVVGNAKTFAIISQFFPIDITKNQVEKKEGETLTLGKHTLQFFTAPMVHWPEVMVAYDQYDKTLYSADAFGRFGTLDRDDEWIDQARRYYYNIVGKYGVNVQAALKKLGTLDIKTIAPLHGPVLKENLGYYINLYNTWSTYQPEENGTLVAYASIHGNTKIAAEKFADMLREKGEKVKIIDLARGDQSFFVEDAFVWEKLAVVAASYDAGVFPPMEHFLLHLKAKNYQGRKVAIIENGSWGPTAGKVMRGILEGMKNLDIYEETITIKSSLKPANVEQMEQMVAWLT